MAGLLGMLAGSLLHPGNAAVILTAIEYLPLVSFTLAVTGAGLAIPAQLLRNPDFWAPPWLTHSKRGRSHG